MLPRLPDSAAAEAAAVGAAEGENAEADDAEGRRPPTVPTLFALVGIPSRAPVFLPVALDRFGPTQQLYAVIWDTAAAFGLSPLERACLRLYDAGPREPSPAEAAALLGDPGARHIDGWEGDLERFAGRFLVGRIAEPAEGIRDYMARQEEAFRAEADWTRDGPMSAAALRAFKAPARVRSMVGVHDKRD